MTDYNAMADEDFRREVRTFVEREYPQHLRFILQRARWHEMKDWWRKLYERGWIAPNWPREWGGMALDAGKMMIYLEELERYGVARAPDQGIIQVGPLIMRFGTQAQKEHYLPRTLLGRVHLVPGLFGAQLGLGPREPADRRRCSTATHFVVNGQKIWTSLADDSTHCYCWCAPTGRRRSSRASASCWSTSRRPGITHTPDPQSRRARGVLPGVLRQRPRAARRAGGQAERGLDRGQGAARLRAARHRQPAPAAVRAAAPGGGRARQRACSRTPASSTAITALKLDIEDGASLYGRFVEQVKRGEPLGQDVSMLKIWTMETWQRITDLLIEIGAEDGVLEGVREVGGVETDFLSPFYYSRPGHHLRRLERDPEERDGEVRAQPAELKNRSHRHGARG